MTKVHTVVPVKRLKEEHDEQQAQAHTTLLESQMDTTYYSGPSSVSLPRAGVSFRNSLRAGISGLVFPWPWSGAACKEGRTEVPAVCR